MLSVHKLSKSFNLTTLFENATFNVNRGERVAVVGRNGCGKTSLLRIITGEEQASAGRVVQNGDVRLGYLPQGFELDRTATIGEILGRAMGRADALEEKIATLASAIADDPDNDLLQAEFDETLRLLEGVDERKSVNITAALGLDKIDPERPTGQLSGGQKTRLALALILLGDPNFLLLDEPTNHLDITMLEWLEKWLLRFDGAVLFVSHDRMFIDQVATRIIYLDDETRTMTDYVGNYTDFLAQWEQAREKQMQAYADQVAEIKRIKRNIARVKETARSNENRSTSVRKGGEDMRRSGFKDYVRSKAAATAKVAKSRERKLDRYLESAERVEKPKQGWQMNVGFADDVRIGRSVIHFDDLTIGYDTPLLHIADQYVSSGQRIVLTGENGCGKTALLRTVAGSLRPLAGTYKIGLSVQLGYMTQEQEQINLAHTPVQALFSAGFSTETQIRTYLHNYLFTGDEPLKPIAHLSYGQRTRLQLAILVGQGCNCLLLDEPLNHLDIPSRELFEQALMQFSGTILIVAHDRYFIERFATEIWWFEEGAIRREIRE